MSQMVPSCGKRARNAYHGCSCADRRSRRSRPSRPVEGLMRKSGCTGFAVAAAWAILALAPVAEAATVAVRGVVQDGSKQPVAGAAVYLVPAADGAKLAKPPAIEIRKARPTGQAAAGAFTISGVADGNWRDRARRSRACRRGAVPRAPGRRSRGTPARKPLAI